MNDRLELTADEMRDLGYRVVDLLVNHFEGLPDERVPNITRRGEVEARLREPVPAEGSDPADVLAQLQRDVMPFTSHVDHPRFFAFIPSPSNFVSVMADALTSGLNVFAGTWIESAGPSMVEWTVVDWLRDLCGMPEGAGGLCVSGGSMANLTALAAARHVHLEDWTDGAVIYCSDQAHASIDRSLRVLGFSDEQIRRLPPDDAFRLDLHALRRAVAEDRAAGRRPFCVVASAGTTNTGAVDPLDALADFCEAEHLWLHVDGAYGAAAVLCEKGRTLLNGLGRAHSLSLDPHKWLFQPYEIGCVLVRDRRWLKDTFHYLPEYMQDTQRPEEEEVNYCDYGIQLTRSFRALKLWMSIKVFGLDAFRAAVERGFTMAEAAEEIVREMPEWTLATRAQMGILSFRYTPKDVPEARWNDLNRTLVARINADGFAMVSSTVVYGETVLRLCPINPRLTEEDLRASFERFDGIADSLRGEDGG